LGRRRSDCSALFPNSYQLAVRSGKVDRTRSFAIAILIIPMWRGLNSRQLR
jgi:hypothetical protein